VSDGPPEMRLLYLGSTDFPQPKARAIQIVNTCHALARAGADVSLVVGRRGRRSASCSLAAYGLAPHPRLRVVSLPIARIPPGAPPSVLRWFTRLWQASYLAGLAAVLPIELARHRPDVIYARDQRTARLAAGPAHAVGARLGFEVHGLPSFEARHRAGRSALPPAAATRLRKLEDEVFARADRIVTITECARRILIDGHGVEEWRVRTVPDAAASPLSPWERAGVRATRETRAAREAGAVDLRPAVYYVGQLYPWKGAATVIEAAALVQQARFVVVGGLPNANGRDPDVMQLAERARKLGASNRVEFRGYVPYAQVGRELGNADVALLPLPDEPVARYFTSPLKLFDYMAAGVPIVASDLPALREVLRDGENALLVPPGDPAAVAKAIARLLADPGLARRLAARAWEEASVYTWDARAAQLLEFLGPGRVA
jgi:glycosyltransferase involved in cell wall biosynthesis